MLYILVVFSLVQMVTCWYQDCITKCTKNKFGTTRDYYFCFKPNKGQSSWLAVKKCTPGTSRYTQFYTTTGKQCHSKCGKYNGLQPNTNMCAISRNPTFAWHNCDPFRSNLKLTTRRKPKPITTRRKPKPITTRRKPKPITTRRKPKPITTRRKPKPITTRRKPKPITTRRKPKPITTRRKPNPSPIRPIPWSAINKPNPSSGNTIRKPDLSSPLGPTPGSTIRKPTTPDITDDEDYDENGSGFY